MHCKSPLLLLIALFASGMSLVSCQKHDAPLEQEVRVAISSLPSTLDPRFATDAYGMRIVSLLFSSFVRLGPDLKIEGDAAESWSYKDLTYQFRLRPNLSFSNGRKVTAEDIHFTFDTFRSEKNPFHSSLQQIKDIKVQESGNRLVVQIQLSRYSAKLLTSDLPIVRILPKKEILNSEEDFRKNLYGTGSYTFIESTQNTIRLKLRENHPYRQAHIPLVTFKVIRDDLTRFQKLLRGEVDLAQNEITPSKVKTFRYLPKKFQVYSFPGLSMNYLLVNLKTPLLSSRQRRQAIFESLNRKEIVEYKLEALGEVATSILSPTNPGFNRSLVVPDYSLEKARLLIQSSGLKGKSITLKTSNSQSAIDKGRVMAYQLQKAGLDVKIESYEWGTFYGDISRGNFELASLRWVGAFDPDIYRIALHSKEVPPGRNRGHYSRQQFDELVEKGLNIRNEEKRRQHYMKVQRMIYEDLPILPLWYDNQVAIVSRRIKGFTPSKNGDYSPLEKAQL
jgi:peptide/nickel transport system substrate-binding protein